MPRKKCYGSEAEKQRAYRLRKAGLRLVEKEPEVATKDLWTDEILPVPVLAEPMQNREESGVTAETKRGEARESTDTESREAGSCVIQSADSRGGQTLLSGGGSTHVSAPSTVQPMAQGETPPAQNLSKTDQLFDADRPGWYIFGKETKEGNCWECGKKYSTRLEMSRFCSPKCKNAYLGAHFAQKA